MLRNKKARGEMIGGIGRLVLAGISLAVVATILYNVFGSAISGQTDYSESFEEFVNDLNSMDSEPRVVFLGLNKKSAVIGFSKGAGRYECFNCGSGCAVPRVTKIFDKPDDPECDDNACVCVCNGKFKLSKDETIAGISTPVDVGQCQKELICKKLQDISIVEKTIIKKYTGCTEHWNNGFLFANDVVGANGLKRYNRELTKLYVERRGNEIGVCNEDMFNFNEEKLGINGCINKDWTP